DMLAWEKQVATFTSGTAVYHPGGSLASHIAVHCALHHIPVLTTREPKVGETLVPPHAAASFNTALVLRGLALGMSWQSPGDAYKQACRVTLLALHNHVHLKNAPLGSLLVGVGIAFAARLGLCAALGEARHARNARRLKGMHGRKIIYERAWSETTQAKRTLPRVLKGYDTPNL